MSASKETLSQADKLNAIGADLFSKNEIEGARLHFLAALMSEPNHAFALQNLGAALRQLGHYPIAEVIAKRSVLASNGHPQHRQNLGVSQMNLRKFDESLETFRAVLKDSPNDARIWHNYGLVLYCVGNYKEALAAFDRSLSLDETSLWCRSDRSLALLSLGKIQEGLASYEARWLLLKKSPIWALNLAEWQGEPLTGRRILVHHEQGFGDTVMLSRFLHRLARRGCHITFACPQELVRLLKRSFPFITVLDWTDEALQAPGAFDFHSPLLSTLRWLAIDRPIDCVMSPYILARAATPVPLPKAKFRIGICWASGEHGVASRDRRRLVPITLFLPLLERPDIALVSLQKGDDVADIPRNGLENLVFDVAGKLDDFATTADLIACLDLVISVDSAVAHVAGATGKPCLMLSPYSRCWRWWGDENGWPWYENMRKFTQSANGDWTSPAANVVRTVLHDIRLLEKMSQ